jgi:hypothetical protein
VRVVALRAVYFLLQHWMVLRQVEFGFDCAMTFQAQTRILARVQNGFVPPAPTADMQAARTMTGFAAGQSYSVR